MGLKVGSMLDGRAKEPKWVINKVARGTSKRLRRFLSAGGGYQDKNQEHQQQRFWQSAQNLPCNKLTDDPPSQEFPRMNLSLRKRKGGALKPKTALDSRIVGQLSSFAQVIAWDRLKVLAPSRAP